MVVIVGSFAAKRAFGPNGWPFGDKPKDVDVWIREGETPNIGSYEKLGYRVELKVMPVHIMAMMEHRCRHYYELDRTTFHYPSLSTLLTIKYSHMEWDWQWPKTLRHIMIMRKELPNFEIDMELYRALRELWKKEKGYKEFLSLNKPKEEFFNDYVVYEYDHDYLHTLAAGDKQPAYIQCLKEGEDVLTDYTRYLLMEQEERERMFMEEITVIACERFLLKKDNKLSIHEAHMLALQKCCTRLFKNWAAEDVVLNIHKYTAPNYTMYNNVLDKLRNKDMNKMTNKQATTFILDKMKEFEYSQSLTTSQCINALSPLFDMVCVGASLLKREHVELINKLNFLPIESKENYSGSSYIVVFMVGGEYFRTELSMNSYSGIDTGTLFSSLEHVVPTTETITVYK